MTTFNARVEGVATAATFREAWRKRRCIVPASAWFEWTGQPGAKIKHRIVRTDGLPIWFAGLWDRAETSDEGEVRSFTILTGPSTGWLRDYHTRAPLILEPEDWMGWLDPSADSSAALAAVRPERFALAQ